jgi:hypothetical protein
MIYLTAIGLTPGGSGTVHIYTQYTEYRDGTHITNTLTQMAKFPRRLNLLYLISHLFVYEFMKGGALYSKKINYVRPPKEIKE